MEPADKEFVTVVSGLPRSGTSMMMQMLDAGGMPVLTDGLRTPDEDNLKGYYEYEPVKRMKHDTGWLAEAAGSAVKVVYLLLHDLPQDHRYRVVFMRRNLSEVLASQQVMLDRLGEQGAEMSASQLEELFGRQLDQIDGWLAERPNFDVLNIDYRRVIAEPLVQAEEVNRFLDGGLGVEAMAAVVDPALFRQRRD